MASAASCFPLGAVIGPAGFLTWALGASITTLVGGGGGGAAFVLERNNDGLLGRAVCGRLYLGVFGSSLVAGGGVGVG